MNTMSETTPKSFLIDTQEIKVAVDIILLAYYEHKLHLLLIQRQYDPDAGMWALPGGFVKNDEELLSTVKRVITDETGLVPPQFIKQSGTFGSVLRDPRHRVVSVAYMSLTNELGAVSGQVKDYMATKDAKWLPRNDIPADLAFDHEMIYSAAIAELKELVMQTDAAKWFMPPEFTLTELQKLYEAIFDGKLEKRNFRKNISQRDILVDTKKIMYGSHRPAKLYSFK